MTERRPGLSLIVPCYNVAPYLPAFLASVAAQRIDPTELELIFVDDGSTDDTAELIRVWLDDHGFDDHGPTRLISQPNGGLAAARNAGLAVAQGEWVSFPDPDDVLGANYLSLITSFLGSADAAGVALVCARVLILDDATGDVADSHPLRYRFGADPAGADTDPVIISARQRPDRIHLQAASACYRLDRLRSAGLEFDGRVRPNYEDGQLTARYLWTEDDPKIAFLPAAEYRYRRRADGSSLVQTSWQQTGRYTDVVEHGYLAVLRELSERHGTAPRWAQLQVLYDLFFTFREDERQHAASGRLAPEITERFHTLVAQLRPYLDDWVIEDYAITWTSDRMRQALLHGYAAEPHRPTEVRIQRLDAERRLGLVRYYFTGPAPAEQVRYDGRVIIPAHAKTRAVTYLDRPLLWERMIWLPMLGELEISLDGRPVPIELGPPERRRYTTDPEQVWQRLARTDPPVRTEPVEGSGRDRLGPLRQAQDDASTGSGNEHPNVPGGEPRDGRSRRGSFPEPVEGQARITKPPRPRSAIKIAKKLAGRAVRPIRSALSPARPEPEAVPAEPTPKQLKQRAAGEAAVAAYGDCWLFVDRDVQAQDNAEHLYRYVREQRPEINSWFVLRADSPDRPRLAAEGFRLIDFGTAEHTVALLNCRHLLSSQADHYISRPLDVAVFGKPRWRFTFLQHGVMQDDLSRWLNSKPIQTFVTSARPEFDAITGDGGGWNFTSKEVRLTGLPRHDALLAKAKIIDETGADRRLVIMPTWRRWLLGPDTESNDRAPIEDFFDTQYARRWTELITDPGLTELAAEAGAPMIFVPHPNLRRYFNADAWPIEVFDYATGDLQDVLARASMLITDYSSISAEAGYLQRPVIYYQFDRTEFYGGSHLGRSGGQVPAGLRFGPVLDEAAEVVDHVRSAAARGFAAEQQYLDRMLAAFPYRDGRCCERVVEAVRASRRPATEDEIFSVAQRDRSSAPDYAGVR